MVERIVQSRDYEKNSGLLKGNSATNNDSEINEETPQMKAANASASASQTPVEGPRSQLMSEKMVNVGGSRRPVRILTINMFMRPVVNTNGTDHKEGRLRAFCDRYLQDYDIICFQELFDWLSTRKQRIISEAKKHGMQYHAFSPAPRFFSTFCCDGGLLTVSRYPILTSDFTEYKFPPVGDDAISMKGVLYTEIDLSEIGGAKFHLFHSHFQASYYGKGIPLYVETFVCRYEQIKEMYEFVHKRTIENPRFNGETDLVLLAGDFNQNAAPMNRLQKEYYDLIKAEPRYRPIIKLFHDEYRSMLNALRHQPANPNGWTVVDCLRHSQGDGRINPISFADVEIDEDGNEQPCEPELIGDEDSCSKQALDYIFWLLPNEQPDVPAILSSVPNCQLASQHCNNQNVEQVKSSKLRVAVEKTRLEKLPVDGFIFKYCSDHFGISTVIE